MHIAARTLAYLLDKPGSSPTLLIRAHVLDDTRTELEAQRICCERHIYARSGLRRASVFVSDAATRMIYGKPINNGDAYVVLGSLIIDFAF